MIGRGVGVFLEKNFSKKFAKSVDKSGRLCYNDNVERG